MHYLGNSIKADVHNTIINIMYNKYQAPLVPMTSDNISKLFNYSESILPVYISLVEKGNKEFIPGNSESMKTCRKVESLTGLRHQTVLHYLNSLYDAAQQGKIDTYYWKPKSFLKPEERDPLKKIGEGLKDTGKAAMTPLILIVAGIAGIVLIQGMSTYKMATKRRF